MSREASVFVHPSALVETEDIGPESRIWAFAHVMKNVRIGKGCNVGDHSFIESGVTVGDDVTIKNGVSIWEGVSIADNVFIGPNVAFTNDLRPRSKVYHSENIRTNVGKGASIGANATIVAGVTLGEYCMVGAGSVVTKSVKPFELVRGNPARHGGWIDKLGNQLDLSSGPMEIDGDRYVFINGIVTIESISKKH